MKIAILGAGGVGTSLGSTWAGKNHQVRYGVRNPASDKARTALAATRGAQAMSIRDAVAWSPAVAGSGRAHAHRLDETRGCRRCPDSVVSSTRSRLRISCMSERQNVCHHTTAGQAWTKSEPLRAMDGRSASAPSPDVGGCFPTLDAARGVILIE